ncbi:MAG: hypothetical protein KIH65_000760 [Candidatus Uhrbacteria bacterium]|nr:hypothetical protein [Candidatus Uhrbacteria bacterium]
MTYNGSQPGCPICGDPDRRQLFAMRIAFAIRIEHPAEVESCLRASRILADVFVGHGCVHGLKDPSSVVLRLACSEDALRDCAIRLQEFKDRFCEPHIMRTWIHALAPYAHLQLVDRHSSRPPTL